MVAQVVPKEIMCKICGEVCKRGVKLGCCSTVGCRSCATKSITRDKKCWNCGTEALSKDMINDEELRSKVEKFQKGEWSQVKDDTKSTLMKSPAPVPTIQTPNKPTPTSLPGPSNTSNVDNKNIPVRKEPEPMVGVTPRKKYGVEVSLEMMKKRNLEFEEKLSDIEKACKELQFGAQLELMFTFDQTQAGCRMCGENFESEELTLLHLQQQHKVEFGHLKTVLNPPNNNVLQLQLQKAIHSEFMFAKDGTFPFQISY